MSDVLVPFLFDGADVRGAVVSLDASWRDVLLRRPYSQAIRSLLGEAYAAAALLGSTLKFGGKLALQTQSTDARSPVRLMVVECNADLGMRAMAKHGAGVADGGGALALPALIGDGKLVITLDPQDGQAAYQGVVPLTGERLNLALEHYMAHSEQLDTRIWLAADETRAAGLLIQRVPDAGGKSGVAPAVASRWPDAAMLASTVRSAELLTLPPRQLLRRLFHEFDLRVFDERATRFRCSCSKERVAGMLRMLGREEVESLLAEQGEVKVDCEFCNQAYAFDGVDAAQLFVPTQGDGSVARH